jgi:general secretion pathway protein F
MQAGVTVLSQRSQVITVEQLLALNDEIRALARAGVPLEKGLRALGADLPGRLGRLATSLSERLERGESFVHALESSGDTFPPIYRAVVAAGVRSGRLPAALESISRSVRQAAELRQTLMVALAYPLVLAAIATAIFVFSMINTAPKVVDVYEMLGVERPMWYVWSTMAAEQLGRWMPWLWVVIAGCVALWWYQSNRAARFGSHGWGWLPTVGGVRAAGRMATFTELLAMLVEQHVPLQEALSLAAASAGGKSVSTAAATLSDALRRGDSNIAPPPGIPQLVTWLILTSPRQPDLVRALRHSANVFRRKAIRMSIFLGTYLPIFLSALIGGLIALYYTVHTMAPVYYLMFQLGQN